ncbi:apolipoprotein N-acyltransferase [Shewanella sp. SR44-3]|uniref:apolipoprotein N-acyltransferase n=1 Tax=Shewanella sp. SR44-3 TaxID=2760936 RepID=UPI0015FC3D48|nr:apolipoprotein N-acyltransferase [Shewanella sp. SR44-3]MBB1268952.1 apolipoprotein N-acyltransferase [Shewanella sp. SR44-3]
MQTLSTLGSNKSLLRLVSAFAAGASTALSFAPYGIWIIYPLALGLSLLLAKNLSPKQAFNHWLSFGFGSFVFGISWVHVSIDTFGGMPLIVSMSLMALLALYLALYPALAGYLMARLTNHKNTRIGKLSNLALFPALWVLTEWLRGWVMTGFPWLWAGYSQTQGPLSALASVIGALGLSFVIALVAASLAYACARPKSLSHLSPSIMILAVLAVCTWLTPKLEQVTPSGETVKVALVQGNIAQSMKWQPDALWPTMLKYMDLTRNNFDADIIIWPEAAIPAPESMVGDFLANANKVANLNDSAIITGIISHRQDEFYNSLIVLGNSNAKQQDSGDYLVARHFADANAETDATKGRNEFRKHHLLPIGEFVPFGDLLRPIAPLFNLPMSSFTRGNYLQPNLNAVGYQISPAICYEIVFPEQVRANVNDDTDMLLTVSNDAWFGSSNGPLQHMEIAQMRAIEMGRPLLRGTNNGVTAVVDHHGVIQAKLPQFETGVLRAEVVLVTGQTWFQRIGQAPLLWLCGLLVFAAALIRRQQSIVTTPL